MEKIIAYTDGSCKPNPGIGGWGFTATLIFPDRSNIIFEDWGGNLQTTNSRMEMTALYKCLKEFHNYNDITLEIYCDNNMCVQALTNKKEMTEIKFDKNGKILNGWMGNWLSYNKDYNKIKYHDYDNQQIQSPQGDWIPTFPRGGMLSRADAASGAKYSTAFARGNSRILPYWNTDRLNGDLWYKIHQSLLKHHKNGNVIKIGWVKGHNGNKGNERADHLSNKFYKKHI